MSDSTQNLDTIATAQANKEVTANELFDALSPSSIYGRRASTCSGLTWGYYGGRWGGNSIANGTLSLTGSATNYVVVAKSGGAVSVSTSTTNWNDSATYARAYQIVTGTSSVTSYQDHRAGALGASGAGSDSGTVGRHAVPVIASAMQPAINLGCAALASVAQEGGSPTPTPTKPDIVALNFDNATQEYAMFSIPMPKSWNEGTVTFVAYWSHSSGGSSFGVVWDLAAVAVSNDDTLGATYGTAQTSTDTGGTADDLYVSPESSAITIAGTPAAEDLVHFRVSRVTGNGSDTLDIDARLHAIVLYITTAAETDA